MSDLFDTTSVRDHPQAWDALAERVVANATREWRSSGFEWLAHSRAAWVGGPLLLAGAMLFMASRVESSSTRSPSGEWSQALMPTDEMGKAISLPDGPPAIGVLLLGRPGGS